MIVLNVAKKADITSVSFFSATQVLLTAVTKELRRHRSSRSLWDVTTTTRVPPAIPTFSAHGFGELRSGDWRIGVSTTAGLAAHHPATGRTVVEPTESKPTRITLTPDGRTVLFCWSVGERTSENGFASRTWSPESETFGAGFRVTTIVPAENAMPMYQCDALIALPDKNRFVATEWYWDFSPQLVIRSVSTGEVLAVAEIAGREAPSLAVAPDGARVVVAVLKSLYVFSTDDLTPQQHVKNDGRKHFTGIAFHPSGRYLAATSNDQTVKLYDTTTWTVAKTYTWDVGRMRSVAFSPDGTLAAAGSDTGKVVVWDVDL
ncbi:possible transcriptional fis family protein : WD-40 repeat protein OS=Cyanothece sp. (strain PCC 7424) GN=PCC7424_1234 PE=4 SV=1: WD40: WD40 [Gemmataceae bacterium]|nr:possible transcriptional fis family protein : WD-40 repeat protein OS=Cyanothece sp. (strain PCC 7424) GN=PCC7424_1234 PE=4 SV=1: WD40: WD40 [Gemmataceae bacterium]VTT98004.1 possible transcriptional fis family protein : WD-40 repeat protein OS=Cyanothece sp. (strain PCC 7424) GN=PCC7424_1234 PE=4 SV=1: WD40: WD40 [Gemmataceae bacterium]